MEKVNKITRLTAVFALCVALLIASAGFRASSYNNGGCLGSVPATRTTIAVDVDRLIRSIRNISQSFHKLNASRAILPDATVKNLKQSASYIIIRQYTRERRLLQAGSFFKRNRRGAAQNCDSSGLSTHERYD